MAAAQDVSLSLDNICICSICLEKFKIPKYLPCLHSFCETCLDTHIQSSINKEDLPSSTGFKCPVCRSIVTLEKSSENPNTWARQMPLNHLIISIMDRIAIEKMEKLCDSCNKSQKKENAVFWCAVCEEAFCTDCEKCHRNFKTTSSHKTIDIKCNSTEDTDRLLAGTIIHCDQHSEESIKVFCVDHNKPCCTICATTNHRKCEKVVAIDEVVSGYKHSLEVKAIMDKLNKMSSELEEIAKKRNENILHIEKQNDEILQSVVKLKDSMIIHLDKLDNTFRSELTCATMQVLLPLKQEETALSSYKCTVDNWRKIHRSCISYGSEVQCFVETNKINSKRKQMDKDIQDLTSKMSSPGLKFTPDITLANLQTRLTSIGTLTVDRSHVSSTRNLTNAQVISGETKQMDKSAHDFTTNTTKPNVKLTTNTTLVENQTKLASIGNSDYRSHKPLNNCVERNEKPTKKRSVLEDKALTTSKSGNAKPFIRPRGEIILQSQKK